MPIVHVGYAKRTLENWATFSFPRCLSISITFSLTQLKNKKSLNAQPFTEKKKVTVIYSYYHPSILISLHS